MWAVVRKVDGTFYVIKATGVKFEGRLMLIYSGEISFIFDTKNIKEIAFLQNDVQAAGAVARELNARKVVGGMEKEG